MALNFEKNLYGRPLPRHLCPATLRLLPASVRADSCRAGVGGESVHGRGQSVARARRFGCGGATAWYALRARCIAAFASLPINGKDGFAGSRKWRSAALFSGGVQTR